LRKKYSEGNCYDTINLIQMSGHFNGFSNLDAFNSMIVSPDRDITWGQIPTAADRLIFGGEDSD
jgi:hypothetical protein